MNRRSFLRWLGGTVAGAVAAQTLDVDQLLWVPGERTIFLPETIVVPDLVADEWVAPLYTDWVTKECLDIMSNSLKMTARINREYERKCHLLIPQVVTAGDVIHIQIPTRWQV